MTTKEKLNKIQADSLELIKKEVLTEREILNLKKRLNNHYTAKGRQDADFIRDNWDDSKEYQLTAEQNENGRAWLQNFTFCKDGSARKAAKDLFDTEELGIIKGLKHFTFCGWHIEYRCYRSAQDFYPIYCVYDEHGAGFRYTMIGHDIRIVD